MIYPVDQRIVIPSHIPFGQPDSAAKYNRHAGDDSANGIGTPVYAPSSGTVTPYTQGQYTGNVVEIFTGKYYPHVFHLSRQVVSPGQHVDEGQLIGYSGATGQGVTGPHIHFGVSKVSVPNTRSFDDYIDPLSLINDEGDDMTAANLNQMRMILFSIRGYNGQNGRPNALTGEADDIIKGWVGKDLGEAVDSWWNDKGSQNFREKEQPDLYNKGPSKVRPYDGPPLFIERN